MTTEKIYLQDMYSREIDAMILEIDENKIILDRTVFYAESGGQLGDTGFMDGFKVIDTQKKITAKTRMLTHPDFPSINVNTDVVHYLENPKHSLSRGQTVKLAIDWDRRYAMMRLHSAAHVVWYFVERVIGDIPIKGCLIGPEKARLDFGAKINPESLPELNDLSNSFISKNLEIKNIPLQNEPEALNWICGQVEIPCGGTHVKQTSEIGHIDLKRRSQGKKLDRLYISLGD